jgi:predicted MFS family arabinose efflux permease
MRSFSRVGLGAITAAAMAISTFPIIVASVLAAQLIEEFGITRAQVGLLATASGLVGSLASPFFGRLTDRLGAVRSTTTLFIVGGVALSLIAISPTYVTLFGAGVLCGLPNGWCNPATNALIVDNVPAGARGLVTGVKQSGVQVGTFLGGLLLPVFSAWWSWRVAVLTFLAIPVAGLSGMIGREDHERARRREAADRGDLPTAIRWIMAYGFISGMSSSAMVGFIPLFANERLGWTEPAAGTLVAMVGIAGIAARIAWPRLAEKSTGHGWVLRVIALLTTVSASLLWLAEAGLVPTWALVPAALLLGTGAVAWNGVGMLAVMDFVPPGLVGKGTGQVLFGFLLGLAIGPPLMGLSVDSLGTYAPGWATAAALTVICAALAMRIPSPRPSEVAA